MPQTFQAGPEHRTASRERGRTGRVPASWRRLATRPRNPITGLNMYGPWSSLKPYALKLLKHDQARMRRMLKELDHAQTGGERTTQLGRVESELAVYSRLEHEVFYPAYRRVCRTVKQRKVYHECVELHRAIELHLADLRKAPPESAQFGGRARSLRLACLDLFREEQRVLFPQARRLMGRANLKALGRTMQDHRRAILRNPGLQPMSTIQAAPG